ncbi:MAG TPA: MerR family transcriptional regulator [Chloroflexota bacterium]
MTGAAPAVLRPGEAGRAVGVKPSTLRVYAQRFADLLSEDAGGSGHNGYRVFSEQDVALLRQARELLERGLTYERAASQLRGAGHGSRPSAAPRRREGARAPDSGVDGRLAILEQAVQAWRALAEERAAEVRLLKQELRDLQERLALAQRAAPLTRARPR